MSSYTSQQPSIRSYTDYLRIAERGRQRRAAFDQPPDAREARFTVYLRGANSDKENSSRKNPPKTHSSRIANCSWGLKTVQIRASDGGCISLRPPERQSSVRPRNYRINEDTDDIYDNDPFEDAPSIMADRPSPHFRLNDSLDSGSSEADTVVDVRPSALPQMSPLPLSGTPVSLADKLVDKILRLDSARQLALLKKLETRPIFRDAARTAGRVNARLIKSGQPLITALDGAVEELANPEKFHDISPVIGGNSATPPVVESIQFVLTANWGDPLYVGLHSIEIFDDLGRRLVVKNAEPAGAIGLFRPSSSEAPDFVVEFDEKRPPKIEATFFCKSRISKILVTNFNSNMAALHKGVKTIEVFAHDVPLAHAEIPKTPFIPEDGDEGRFALTFYHPIKHRP